MTRVDMVPSGVTAPNSSDSERLPSTLANDAGRPVTATTTIAFTSNKKKQAHFFNALLHAAEDLPHISLVPLPLPADPTTSSSSSQLNSPSALPSTDPARAPPRQYDAILYKRTDDMAAAATGGDAAAARRVRALHAALASVGPSGAPVVSVDPIPGVWRLVDRASISAVVESTLAGIPRLASLAWANIGIGEARERKAVEAALAGLRFPIILKRRLACGSKASHEMVIAYDWNGIHAALADVFDSPTHPCRQQQQQQQHQHQTHQYHQNQQHQHQHEEAQQFPRSQPRQGHEPCEHQSSNEPPEALGREAEDAVGHRCRPAVTTVDSGAINGGVSSGVVSSPPFIDEDDDELQQQRRPQVPASISSGGGSLLAPQDFLLRKRRLYREPCLSSSAASLSTSSSTSSLTPSPSSEDWLPPQRCFDDRHVIAQEYVPEHGGLVFKLYAVGENINVRPRASVTGSYDAAAALDGRYPPPVPVDGSGGYFKFDSQKINKDLVPRHSGLPPPPPEEMTLSVVRALRKELGLTLMGIDFVYNVQTQEYSVVDVNYFPGYSGVRDVHRTILEHVHGLVQQQRSGDSCWP